MTWLWRERGRPKDVPQWAHTCLVVTLHEDADFIAELRCVERMGIEDGASVEMLRLFRPDLSPDAFKVTDFTSLDEHPELILFEGSHDRATGEVRMRRVTLT